MLGPNITGGPTPSVVTLSLESGYREKGAFSYTVVQNDMKVNLGTHSGYYGLNFNANNSSAIYSNNASIYPLSLSLNYIIKT